MSEKLHAFIQQMTQVKLHLNPGEQLVSLIQSTFELEAAAIYDADMQKVYEAGEWFAEMENIIRNAYFFESVADDPETGMVRRVLRIGNLPVGALLLRGEMDPQTSSSLADLVAITFDRYHSHANVNRTESARQTEQMRTTVLDSLAHAYKTPLTAIRAASTGLHAMGNLTSAQIQMVQLIDEQSGVLDELTSRLLTTARLEDHDLTLHKERVFILPLIEDVVAGCRAILMGRRVNICVSRESLSICCDRDLFLALLTQYVENAGKYSTGDSPIAIRVAEDPGEIILSVHNFGPVIQPADQECVFDRFFRCADTAGRVSGTGIGLSVAKQAAQAHGGDVWLTSDTTTGTTFFASFPIDPKGTSEP